MATRRYEPTPAWEHALDRPACRRHLLFVVEDRARIVGWCRIFPIPDCQVQTPTAELGIGLLPAYRDQGIGTALVRHALHAAQGAGVRTIVLDTRPDNHRAMRVFQGCGFFTYVHESYDRINMMCHLGL